MSREGDLIVMDFPAVELKACPVEDAVCEALGARALEAAAPVSNPWQLVYRFESRAQVEALEPDFPGLKAASPASIICTAEGEDKDFVSRFFGPQVGINEDPVTGSAHCALTPFWAERLGKSVFSARQVSARGGDLVCELAGDRVVMKGRAVTFMQGRVSL